MKKYIYILSIIVNILLFASIVIYYFSRPKQRIVADITKNKLRLKAEVTYGGATVQNFTKLTIYEIGDKPKISVEIKKDYDSIDYSFSNNVITTYLFSEYNNRIINTDTLILALPKRLIE